MSRYSNSSLILCVFPISSITFALPLLDYTRELLLAFLPHHQFQFLVFLNIYPGYDSMEQHLRNSNSGPSKIPTLDISRKVGNPWGIPSGADSYHALNDATLFSSSLPVLPHQKLNRSNPEHYGSVDVGLPKFQKDDELDEIEANKVGCLPDDEDELLAGIMDDFDLSGLPSQLEDLEDDLFDSGGGMEMDLDAQESIFMGMSKLGLSEGVNGDGVAHYAVQSGGPTVAGEHPYGEHPSRTLFVRNINSNVEESELRSLFEQYGDIRTMYTACKHRGFVMISYYDIRAARTAMRALQNKPLRRRKLDIHFSIPKDNPSEKDINQGTLVVFNLDASVSNDDLRQIFGAYGEVKEIRETPHKRHHKFIEFYDVRAADAALKALNRRDIAGKRIKLEPSRPGGARRNLMQQLTQELELDETRTYFHQIGSPIMTNSPPGNWTHFSSPVDQSPLQSFSRSPGFEQQSPVSGNHLTKGLASALPTHVSNPVKIAPIGKDNPKSPQASLYLQNSHSFSDQKLGTASPGPTSSLGEATSIGTLSGPQFLWGSPTPKSPNWPTSSVGPTYTYSNRQTNFQQQHHVGSAPSFGYFPESPDTSFNSSVGFGGIGINRNNNNNGSYMGVRSVGFSPSGNVIENGSPSTRMMSTFPWNSPVFYGSGSYQGISDGVGDRSRARRIDYAVNQIENKKQYQLDLDKIICGEDTRTTLMIKNIPNKYSSKMLLAAIDENHRGAYDFLYLPIDFKNKCNVGYAFINMVSPSHIISFFQAFNGKKWEKFNSEKVASLAYARIQGKVALVTHFQNSSLMNEDKRCRPILFQSEGQGTSDQESLPYNNLNICVRLPDGSYLGDSLESPTSNTDEKLGN